MPDPVGRADRACLGHRRRAATDRPHRHGTLRRRLRHPPQGRPAALGRAGGRRPARHGRRIEARELHHRQRGRPGLRHPAAADRHRTQDERHRLRLARRLLGRRPRRQHAPRPRGRALALPPPARADAARLHLHRPHRQAGRERAGVEAQVRRAHRALGGRPREPVGLRAGRAGEVRLRLHVDGRQGVARPEGLRRPRLPSDRPGHGRERVRRQADLPDAGDRAGDFPQGRLPAGRQLPERRRLPVRLLGLHEARPLRGRHRRHRLLVSVQHRRRRLPPGVRHCLQGPLLQPQRHRADGAVHGLPAPRAAKPEAHARFRGQAALHDGALHRVGQRGPATRRTCWRTRRGRSTPATGTRTPATGTATTRTCALPRSCCWPTRWRRATSATAS